MIDEIINNGEYRAPLFDKNRRLEQFAVTLPYEVRNEIDGINIRQFITDGVLDFMNQYKDKAYKDKVWDLGSRTRILYHHRRFYQYR